MFKPYKFICFEDLDYDPFGMLMVGRNWVAGNSYRYGFNGYENDDETLGTSIEIDYGARIYDTRLGRFLSRDPIAHLYVWQSPYSYSYNSPICIIDYNGLGGIKAKGYQAKADIKWARHHDSDFNNWYNETKKQYKSEGRTLTIEHQQGAMKENGNDLNTLIGGEISEKAKNGSNGDKTLDHLYYDHVGNGIKTGYNLRSVIFYQYHGGEYNFNSQHTHSIDVTYNSTLKPGLKFDHWDKLDVNWGCTVGNDCVPEGESKITATSFESTPVQLTGSAKPYAASSGFSPYYRQEMAYDGYSYTVYYGITEYSRPVLCYVKDAQFGFFQQIVNPSFYFKFKKQPFVISNPTEPGDVDLEDLEQIFLPQAYFK